MILKVIFFGLLIFSLIIVIRFSMAAQLSQKDSSPGLDVSQLKACPDKPNCINTEYPEQTSQYLPALDYPGLKSDQIIPLAKAIIVQMGGEIVTENKAYLAATFTSSIFSFVDDFEVRQNDFSLKLHIRSASRVGYSDFGVNKRRVEIFSDLFKAKIR